MILLTHIQTHALSRTQQWELIILFPFIIELQSAWYKHIISRNLELWQNGAKTKRASWFTKTALFSVWKLNLTTCHVRKLIGENKALLLPTSKPTYLLEYPTLLLLKSLKVVFSPKTKNQGESHLVTISFYPIGWMYTHSFVFVYKAGYTRRFIFIDLVSSISKVMRSTSWF